MKLTKEEGRDIVWGDHPDWDEQKGREIVEQGRWNTVYSAIFKHKPTGKFYELCWSQGSTEMQEEHPFEYSDPEPVEVEEREVTVKKWMPVNADNK